MSAPRSQICCSTRLLKLLGRPPRQVGPEERGLHPLATWYADLFYFNHRKCVLFYNPATGYGIVAANVSKSQIQALSSLLTLQLRESLVADGFSESAADACLAHLSTLDLTRTSDRRTRAFVVKAINDAHFAMGRSVKSDPEALEANAHRMISHRETGPHKDPLGAFGLHLGEAVPRLSFFQEAQKDIYQIQVRLEGIEPLIWRRLVIPSATRLDQCHLILQGALGWTNSHLHRFEAGGKVFEDTTIDDLEYLGTDERQVCLYDLLHMGGGSASYIYDYGDHWVHTLVLEERRRDEVTDPRCTGGARSCPPEDVGGVGGYWDMLKALADHTDPEHESYREWLPEGWEAERFTADAANAGIEDMTSRRPDYWL